MSCFDWIMPEKAKLTILETQRVASLTEATLQKELVEIGLQRPDRVTPALVRMVFDSIMQVLMEEGRTE